MLSLSLHLFPSPSLDGMILIVKKFCVCVYIYIYVYRLALQDVGFRLLVLGIMASIFTDVSRVYGLVQRMSQGLETSVAFFFPCR